MKASLSPNAPEGRAMAPETGMRPSDKLIPWYFVLFFLVVFVVNGIFIYLALESYTGVVTDEAYEKGLAYDSLLEESREQAEMGIQHKARYEAPVLRLELKDRDGHPIEGAHVTAKMIRPVQAGYDFEVPLTPHGGGVYAADIHPPLPGAWTAKMEAQWDGQVFRTTYKMVTQ